MEKYPKIQSIFKRDEKGNFIDDSFSLPEFEYLLNNLWMWTEKIDGTNIRIEWNPITKNIEIGGRTDNAQIPATLFKKLNELFTVEKFSSLYPDAPMTLYGEGYGAGIQKIGKQYIPDGVSFILFDVMIEKFWLTKNNVDDIADKLNIDVVEVILLGTIPQAIEIIKSGVMSTFGDFLAEGLVGTPAIPLSRRNGTRLLTKIKHRDYGITEQK